MINLEFETFEDIAETLNIVGNAINLSLNKNEKFSEFSIEGEHYKINTNTDSFKAGLLYGLSISKDISNTY
jgi:hypothetical protein